MLALLCSGQGTQSRDMFRLTGAVTEAEPVFQAAAVHLGSDPRIFVKEVEPATLFANEVAQVLCVTQAMAAYVMLRSSLPEQYVVAGYSVGELAAWGVAGLFTPQQTVDMAQTRGKLMTDGSGPDDVLGFVRGLPERSVEALALAHHVDVAIINTNQTFVIGGVRPDVQAFCDKAHAIGAERSGLLGIHVASHTSRLAKVVPQFEDALVGANPKPPQYNTVLISAIDASPVFTAKAATKALAAEIGNTLHWAACLESAYERGARTFLELGPGHALADMAGRLHQGIVSRSVDDFHTVEGACHWLRQHMQ